MEHRGQVANIIVTTTLLCFDMARLMALHLIVVHWQQTRPPRVHFNELLLMPAPKKSSARNALIAGLLHICIDRGE
uniref:Uncharacterized protein n=1 Tax=Arundo donax TaxID=35708 RepID=A0A0A9AVN9_ARUDO